MKKALQLLEIQKDALAAKNMDALGFLIVNRIHNLVPYKSAVFWTGTTNQPAIHSVSGNAGLDPKGSYAIWLQNMIKTYASKEGSEQVLLDAKDIREEHLEDWEKYSPGHAVILIFQTEKDGVLGGVWLERDTKFTKPELKVLEELQISLSYATKLQNLQKSSAFFSKITGMKKHKKVILALCLITLLFPVRLSITAPAEIVSKNPVIIAPAFDGVVEDIVVRPGQKVEEGDLLVKMEGQDLLAQKRNAEQNLNVAKTKLSRLRREALLDPQKKIELEKLRSEISLKEIEFAYAQEQFNRAQIKSPRAGVAIFSDALSFIGKPLATGQEIMQIADPEETELFIRIPSDAILPIAEHIPVRFYMNVEPLKNYRGAIKTIGYQASADPDGLLTYKLRASLPDDYIPRVGWKGTAKIYGYWRPLAYAILRRPLIALRDITGL